MRPLSGRREVFRRLEERTEASQRRVREVRQMGGLEPEPPTAFSSLSHSFGDSFSDTMRGYQDYLVQQLNQTNSSITLNLGRNAYSSDYYSHTHDDTYYHPRPTQRGGVSNYLFQDTERGVDDSFFRYLTGDITEEQYRKINEINKIKQKEGNVCNREAKILLDTDY